MPLKVSAVFDIGKTNKKFFLFDQNFAEVQRTYINLPETVDEDGYPCEDLPKLVRWMKDTLNTVLASEDYDIYQLNFSTYGASFVYIDDKGDVMTPLYNYTKPFENELLQEFYNTYGPEDQFSSLTGTTNAGMLNSGMQIYRLKKKYPKKFEKIKWALHLPQYLSYIFTKKPVSEYTSIGCHTALWDYSKNKYHSWVSEEAIEPILPLIVETTTSFEIELNGKKIKVGVGIHDSSSSLLPYLLCSTKPFMLLSTGTWSVALNPFSDGLLSKADTLNNCINYMRSDGEAVKAARLFLGNEYKIQVKNLTAQYGVPYERHRDIRFDPACYDRLAASSQSYFTWKSLDQNYKVVKVPDFENFEIAYHQLLLELVRLQAEAIRRAQGLQKIKRLYLEGGFSDNEVFVYGLSRELPEMKIRTTRASLGSALGAAMVIADHKPERGFLKESYAVRKFNKVI